MKRVEHLGAWLCSWPYQLGLLCLVGITVVVIGVLLAVAVGFRSAIPLYGTTAKLLHHPEHALSTPSRITNSSQLSQQAKLQQLQQHALNTHAPASEKANAGAQVNYQMNHAALAYKSEEITSAEQKLILDKLKEIQAFVAGLQGKPLGDQHVAIVQEERALRSWAIQNGIPYSYVDVIED